VILGRCPSIDKLQAIAEGASDRKTEAHLERCVACQGILALLVGQTSDGVESEACARAELLVALAEVGTLDEGDEAWLAAHVRECKACAELRAAPS